MKIAIYFSSLILAVGLICGCQKENTPATQKTDLIDNPTPLFTEEDDILLESVALGGLSCLDASEISWPTGYVLDQAFHDYDHAQFYQSPDLTMFCVVTWDNQTSTGFGDATVKCVQAYTDMEIECGDGVSTCESIGTTCYIDASDIRHPKIIKCVDHVEQ